MELPFPSRIAIIGAGALGGYLGARLAHAGHDVHFLLRSDYETVVKEGWLIDSAGEPSFRVQPVRAHRTTETIGPVDLVIIALKATQNDALAQLIPPLLGPKTTLCSIQNGMGHADSLRAAFPGHPILIGMCHIGATKEGRGHLRNHSPRGGLVRLGEDQPASGSRRATQLGQWWADAGVRTEVVEPVEEAIWRKLMWNIPFNGLPVLIGGATSDRILDDPALTELARALMEELRAAAAARGHPIDPAMTNELIQYTRKLGAYTASTVCDLEANRPLEIEPIWGEPLRRGQAAGVAMPHLTMLHTTLRALDAERARRRAAR